MALCAAMLFGIAAAPVAAQRQAKPEPAAILTVFSGDVLMRTARGDFALAMDGAVLYVGTMLRTSADAHALITLFEGSTVELDPASDITIDDATTRSGATIAQMLERSLHVVMHLTTADSRYELTTPAATASVRGGEFEVTAGDALSGVTPTTNAPEHRVVTTVAVATPVAVTTSTTLVTPAQTTSLTNAASASQRSSASMERIRKVISWTQVVRALPAARDRSLWSDRAGN